MLAPITELVKLHHVGLLVFLLSCLVLRNILSGRRRNPRALPHPPGPKGFPLIGNLLDFPVHDAWLVYDKWQKVYGDMVYFEVFGQPFLILGSLRRSTEILEKRICSDRPRLVMVTELMGWDRSFALNDYGSWWQRQRRTFDGFFHRRAVSNFEAIQLRETTCLVRRLLETPDKFVAHIQHAFQATMMDIVYNIRVQETEDPYLGRANEVTEGMLEASVPGRFFVDFIPVLKYVPGWFPGAGFKRWAAHQASVVKQVFVLPFEEVERRLKSKKLDGASCITAALLERLPQDDDPQREEDCIVAQNVATAATNGGTETILSSVQTIFLAMAMYPDVQRKAQLEIDSVVGPKRFPDFGDREALPYVHAVVKESLRWFQAAPLGVPHTSAEDMEYNGYFIPKGTYMMANSWSIMYDAEEYSDPGEFRPERFLKDGRLNPEVRQPDSTIFGFGRRVCPGKYFALNTLYSIVVSVLAVYDIAPPTDPQGRPMKLEAKFTSGLLRYPVPFRCSIKPRSDAARSLIMEVSKGQKE